MTESSSNQNTHSGSAENRILLLIAGCVVLMTCCIVSAIVCYSLLGPLLVNSNSQTITSNNSDTDVETTTQSMPVVDPEPTSIKRIGDFSVDLLRTTSAEDTLVFSLSVRNETLTDKSFSTIINLELVDATGKQYYQSFSYDISASERLDRKVPANASVTGKVAYTVKDSPKGLKLVVNGGFLSDEKVEFPISLPTN